MGGASLTTVVPPSRLAYARRDLGEGSNTLFRVATREGQLPF
jgi:hypothetical protein